MNGAQTLISNSKPGLAAACFFQNASTAAPLLCVCINSHPRFRKSSTIHPGQSFHKSVPLLIQLVAFPSAFSIICVPFKILAFVEGLPRRIRHSPIHNVDLTISIHKISAEANISEFIQNIKKSFLVILRFVFRNPEVVRIGAVPNAWSR